MVNEKLSQKSSSPIVVIRFRVVGLMPTWLYLFELSASLFFDGSTLVFSECHSCRETNSFVDFVVVGCHRGLEAEAIYHLSYSSP